jgi:thiol:disulfide interchange protein
LPAPRATSNAVGWGFQLQSPVFVAFIAVLLLVLALAMSGLVELTVPVPQPLARVAGTAGAFGDGVLVTLIASACIAPYMGAALAFALTASAPLAVALFAALGLGLALPQGVLMTVPAFLRWLPAPGPWMLTARRVLAVPLVVTAGWLGWVFVQEIAPTPSSSIASFGGATFTTTRLSKLREHHQAVLVDISAAWCITCKVNERIALDRPEVTRRLKQLDVTVLRGDWTKQDPAITAYLRSLGSAGVPLYAYYSPNGKIDVWPQVLTPSLVLGRLEEAKREASVRPPSTPV